MKISNYHQRHLTELTAVYNDLTRPVPHCCRIDTTELADAFAGACGLESHGKRLTEEAVFVAEDGGESIGFVHVGEGATKETGGDAGVIRFLAYPRGRRDIGQALLTRAEEWLRGRPCQTVIVFPQVYRYPFYAFPHAFISNHIEHVQALFLFNGYHISNGEVFLDWTDFNPKSPVDVVDVECKVMIAQEPSAGRLPNITAKAFQGAKQIGVCELLSAREFSRRPEMDELIFCMWLGVEELYQGKRLGRRLLESALVEGKKAGYRHAAISTAWDNYRAQLFYSNHGFTAVDWTYQYRKDFTD